MHNYADIIVIKVTIIIILILMHADGSGFLQNLKDGLINGNADANVDHPIKIEQPE